MAPLVDHHMRTSSRGDQEIQEVGAWGDTRGVSPFISRPADTFFNYAPRRRDRSLFPSLSLPPHAALLRSFAPADSGKWKFQLADHLVV